MNLRLYAVNSWVCFFFGTSLNILLLVLIRYRTGAELRAYSRILVQSAVIDLIVLAYNPLFQPVFIDSGNGVIFYGTGLLKRNSLASLGNRQWNFSLHLMWILITPFELYSLSIQFYYRYATLCKTYLLLLLGFPGVLAILSSADQYMACRLIDCLSDKRFATMGKVIPAEQLPDLVAVFNEWNIQAVTSRLLHLLSSLASYSVIVWCSAKIHRYMKRTMALLPTNSAMREANIQLNIVLLLQACTPLMVHVLPATYVLLCGLAEMESVKFGTMLTAVFNWLPVMNALNVLVVVKSYRQSSLKTLSRVFCSTRVPRDEVGNMGEGGVAFIGGTSVQLQTSHQRQHNYGGRETQNPAL